MSYILTIDAGTGGGRAIIFDMQGQVVSRVHEEWSYQIGEREIVPFVHECSFDPADFWSVLSRCVRRALENGSVDPAAIAAVVTTSQREGCVFLDPAGREVYAGPNFDARGVLEGMEAQQTIGEARLHEITGHAPPYIFPVSRYLWFHKNRPNETVRHMLMISDWITYRLTGEVGMERSNASESMLFDVRKRGWSEEILDRLNIPATILPPLREPGTQIGVVTQAAADATGLRTATPVMVGGADTQAALLGTGVIEPGETGVIIGSTLPVQMVLAEPRIDPAGSLWTGCHLVRDRWVLESNGGDAGSAYGWLLELLGATTEPDPYATAESWLGPRTPGARVPCAFVGPTIFDLAHLNPFRPAGILFPYPFLHTRRPDRGELIRAFLENIAFAVRANAEQITAVADRGLGSLRVSGGMSRTRVLNEILADLMERPVRVSAVADSAGLGCAILGAFGIGAYPDVAAAVNAMVRVTMVEPRAPGSYAKDYSRWRQLYDQLDHLNL